MRSVLFAPFVLILGYCVSGDAKVKLRDGAGNIAEIEAYHALPWEFEANLNSLLALNATVVPLHVRFGAFDPCDVGTFNELDISGMLQELGVSPTDFWVGFYDPFMVISKLSHSNMIGMYFISNIASECHVMC